MRILVCGANGFIGSAIAERLTEAGHTVVRGVRHPATHGDVAIDYTRDFDLNQWIPRLEGIDVVVNAVGIIVETRRQKFDDIHRKAPIALFTACQMAGVRRVLQISALGADRGDTPYFNTKRAADEFLMAQQMEWQIVRPALVYGRNGSSARLFRMLASLPFVLLPAGGHQRLQPVHVDDLAETVLRLLDPETIPDQCVELVGPTEMEYREMLRGYRAALAFPPAVEITIPAPLIALATNTIGRIPGVILTRDTWKMLCQGNTGSPAAITRLLGSRPRALADFIPKSEAPLLRHEALAAWQFPLLRIVLAFVWILSGLLSMFVFPVVQSLELLAKVGLTGGVALMALYVAAVLDIALGLFSLLQPGRRLWLIQMVVIVAYTAIIAVALPEYLSHPFGPVTKNLPILAILLILLSEEREA